MGRESKPSPSPTLRSYVNLHLLTATARHAAITGLLVLESVFDPLRNSPQGTTLFLISAIKILIQLSLFGSAIILYVGIQQRNRSKSILGLFAKITLEIVSLFHYWFAKFLIRHITNQTAGRENIFIAFSAVVYLYIFVWEMLSAWTFIIVHLSGSKGPLRCSIICGIKFENLLYVHFLYALSAILTLVIKICQQIVAERSMHQLAPLSLIFHAWTILLLIIYCSIMPDLYFGIKNKCPKRVQRHLYGKTWMYILWGPKIVLRSAYGSDFIQEKFGPVETVVQACQITFLIFEFFTLKTYLELLKYLKQLDWIGLEQNTMKYVVQHVEINRSRLTIDTRSLLGEGVFGKVYKGTFSSRANFRKTLIMVAVKSLKCDLTQIDALLSELKALALIGTGHENVVKFYGVNFIKYQDQVSSANLVFEYCEKGSLDLFLKSLRESLKEESDFENPTIKHQLTLWGFQIAKGMEFISSQKIVHGDLAARNILLDSNFVAKISDFGMARKLYTYQKYATSLQTVFPWRWMAPESLAELRFSLKSDIWAYGILLWEIFSLGSQPWNYIWISDFATVLKSGQRLEKPIFASDDLYHCIMLQCWCLDSNHRIPFSEIVRYFEHSSLTAKE